MRRTLQILYILFAMVMVACNPHPSPSRGEGSDTVYTKKAVMSIYAYQPERALEMLDSAVIVGNINEWQADVFRARIYSSTQMFDQMDSLLGGTKDVRFDSARTIGERLLGDDSVKVNPKRLLDVLEILSYTARMQDDTTKWLQRSREFVDICHKLGKSQETNALRTEAEIGAALCAMGHGKQGMAKLDSAIYTLSGKQTFKFGELDALIIALKRKIRILSSENKYAETLPLASRIIEMLDNYEKHPEKYHDGSYREPKNDEKREDYITFYRNQAHNYIIAAYSALGEHGNMIDTFEKIQHSVREATAREHRARYNALLREQEARNKEQEARRYNMIAVGIGIFSLMVIIFSVVVCIKNRSISRKNHQLAQQISDAVKYKELYYNPLPSSPIGEGGNVDINALDDEQLFQYVNEIVVREKLFLSPTFGRQTIMNRFALSKERVGNIFSKGSEYDKLTDYVQRLRLEHAAMLLINQPDMSVVQIANECGFSSHSYFSSCFRHHFGIRPSDYRKNV